MKPGSVIHRYVFRELIPPFLISLAFLIFVFLMTTLIDITDLIVNYRVGFGTVLMMITYSMPFFLQFIIPMSIMMGVLLTFLRMSGDNEIIALKAGGMSIYGMLPPVILFCLIGCLITGFMSVYGLPWGRLSVKSLKNELNTTSLTAFLKERAFNDSFDNRTLYVTKINPRENTLSGIFIEDRSTKNQVVTIVAPGGRLIEDSDNRVYHLQLEQGRINQTDIKTKTVNATDFDKYDVRLDLNRALTNAGKGPKDEEEMSIPELREYVRAAKQKDDRYYLALMEFHKKFSIPSACLALGLLAMPLGIQSKSAKRSFGIGLGLFFFLAYYLILSAGFVFGEAGSYPPLIGMWAPNIIMGGIGGFLLIRCARERDIGFGRHPFKFKRTSTPETRHCTLPESINPEP
jgi:lipopolysaccharide export system permease protein